MKIPQAESAQNELSSRDVTHEKRKQREQNYIRHFWDMYVAASTDKISLLNSKFKVRRSGVNK